MWLSRLGHGTHDRNVADAIDIRTGIVACLFGPEPPRNSPGALDKSQTLHLEPEPLSYI